MSPQAPKRSEITHRRGRFRQSEDGCNFLVRQLFEVTHENNLAVVLFQGLDGCLQAGLKFLTDGGGGRGQFVVEEFGSQFERGAVGRRESAQGSFALEAAPLGQAVAAMGVDDVVAGHVPQPEMKGHRRGLEVIAQATTGLQQYLLHHITGINPAGQSGVESKIDHAPQRRAVAQEKLV